MQYTQSDRLLDSINGALLRDGRLKGMHKFTKIRPERAKKIAEVLGWDIDLDGPMTLAEICASKSDTAVYRPNTIGFTVGSNGLIDTVHFLKQSMI